MATQTLADKIGLIKRIETTSSNTPALFVFHESVIKISMNVLEQVIRGALEKKVMDLKIS